MFEVRKDKTNVIRGEMSEFKGKTFVNLRIWYEDRDGDVKPGRQGISIPPGLLSDVISGLQTLQAENESAS